MKKLLLLFALLISFSVFAEYSIKGTISDDNNAPALFAPVWVAQNGEIIKGIETDLDGRFSLGDLPKGKYELNASYVGFLPIQKMIEILNQDLVLNLDFNQVASIDSITLFICNGWCYHKKVAINEPVAVVDLPEVVVTNYAVPKLKPEICSGGAVDIFPKVIRETEVLNLLPLSKIKFPTQIADNFSITGSVTCSETGEPLLFANIAAYQNGKLIKGVHTDSDGDYSIEDLPKGTYDVEVSYMGFETKLEKNFEIRADTELNFSTAPANVQLSVCVIVGENPKNERKLIECYGGVSADEQKSDSPIVEQNQTLELSSNFEFNLFPNPTTDYLFLDFSISAQREIQILASNGAVLFQQMSTEKRVNLSLPDFISGTYYVRVSEMGKVAIQKVILIKE